MILAIPYHSQLPVDFKGLFSKIKKARGNQNHTLLIVFRTEDEDAAKDLGDTLEGSFGKVFFATMMGHAHTPTDGANKFLQSALRFLRAYRRDSHEPEAMPLVYLDPTWAPDKHRWLDELQTEYYLKGAPVVMGNYEDPNNPFFRGAVVFSPSFLTKSTLIDYLPPDTHWKKFLAWELKNNAVVTNSIGEAEESLIRPRQSEPAR